MGMIVRLFAKFRVDVPLEVRKIRPDVLASLDTIDKLSELPVWLGNTRLELNEVFDVQIEGIFVKNPSEITIVFEGEYTRYLRYVGYRMTSGRIEVRGDVGPLAGYRMAGGELVIFGSADHYLGAKMSGGKIEVFGNAGSFVGGKLIGEKYGKGMRGGTIVIHGNAGSFIGHGMQKGDIIVEGDVGNFVGYGMKGGNILIHGNAGLFPGARMSGGRIIVLGRVEDVLPSFYIDDIVREIKYKGQRILGPFAIFVGDVLMESRGRLIISYEKNMHILQEFEELLKVVEVE